jgi:hypothetical protein
MLPIIPELQQLSEATTQAAEPYFPPQDLSEAQPAPIAVTEHHATTAVGVLMKPVSRGRYLRRRSVVSSLFSIGLIIGALGLFIAYLQMSAALPVLDAPIWGVHDGYVALLHPENRALLKSFTEYPASVSSFAANGQYLLAERTVIDLRTGRPVMTFHHAPAPQAVALSDTGKFAALHDGQTLTVWDVKTGDCLHELTGIDLTHVADIFSPTGIERLQVALMKARP